MGVGAAVGNFVVDSAGGVVDGVVSSVAYGIGDFIGVPRTDKTKCEQAIKNGETWEASKYCTGGEFLSEALPNSFGDIWTTINNAPGKAVIEAGKLIGIPETNMTECEKALKEGRTWDAGLACPAGKFIGSFF